MTGWECPKCGRVWAPFTPGCHSCNQPERIEYPVQPFIPNYPPDDFPHFTWTGGAQPFQITYGDNTDEVLSDHIAPTQELLVTSKQTQSL